MTAKARQIERLLREAEQATRVMHSVADDLLVFADGLPARDRRRKNEIGAIAKRLKLSADLLFAEAQATHLANSQLMVRVGKQLLVGTSALVLAVTTGFGEAGGDAVLGRASDNLTVAERCLDQLEATLEQQAVAAAFDVLAADILREMNVLFDVADDPGARVEYAWTRLREWPELNRAQRYSALSTAFALIEDALTSGRPAGLRGQTASARLPAVTNSLGELNRLFEQLDGFERETG